MYIDISHNNGIVWFSNILDNSVKIDGIFIKANEGVGMVDPQLNYNATNTKLVGIPLSYYHFATLNSFGVVDDAVSEAQFFIDTIKDLPVPDMELVLDIETNKIGLKPDQVLIWINTFFNTMKTAGYSNLMIYSYSSFLNDNLPTSHDLAGYPLWIAAYSPKFVIPRGWLNAKYWQYSETGIVSGIKGNVDMTKVV